MLLLITSKSLNLILFVFQILFSIFAAKVANMEIKEILSSTNSIDYKINALRKRTVHVPLWSTLLEKYEPSNHEVVNDTLSLKYFNRP